MLNLLDFLKENDALTIFSSYIEKNIGKTYFKLLKKPFFNFNEKLLNDTYEIEKTRIYINKEDSITTTVDHESFFKDFQHTYLNKIKMNFSDLFLFEKNVFKYTFDLENIKDIESFIKSTKRPETISFYKNDTIFKTYHDLIQELLKNIILYYMLEKDAYNKKKLQEYPFLTLLNNKFNILHHTENINSRMVLNYTLFYLFDTTYTQFSPFYIESIENIKKKEDVKCIITSNIDSLYNFIHTILFDSDFIKKFITEKDITVNSSNDISKIFHRILPVIIAFIVIFIEREFLENTINNMK